jgi:membrane protein YdbS with pleckstrin-like domain|tara:strand:+ start:4015 stop:4242 length:228 start_codon:yes stop_codon:yes gene_type:complete
MEQNQKPYQTIAWTATAILILAAILASFVPELEYHHWAFISANSLWVVVGILWREQTLIVLNAGLTIIYILGLIL